MNKYLIYGHSETGNVRPNNEDHILLGCCVQNDGFITVDFSLYDEMYQEHGLLFAVADGIGGAQGGEVASRTALTEFSDFYYSMTKNIHSAKECCLAISQAADHANHVLMNMASNDPSLHGMGCTLSGVCLTPKGYYLYNAGDSRVYRYREQFLRHMTNDDTLTSFALKNGLISDTEALTHDGRHVLTNCLGIQSFKLDVHKGPEWNASDILLVCSDGLHGMVSHDWMEAILQKEFTFQEKGEQLVTAALVAGGKDNISIILIKPLYDE